VPETICWEITVQLRFDVEPKLTAGVLSLVAIVPLLYETDAVTVGMGIVDQRSCNADRNGQWLPSSSCWCPR